MTFDAFAVADHIGDHLVRTAYHHDGRCTWMGMTQDGEDDSDDLEFTFATLGPDLYGGTSGVALFLSELYARTEARSVRDAAIGGIRHALGQAGKLAGETEMGLYVGAVGIAYAGVRIGQNLQADEITDRARDLVLTVVERRRRSTIVDVTAGISGTIPALLVLSDLLSVSDLRDVADELGRDLLATATRGSEGWCWQAEESGSRPLTGFAHGSAGIGWSLFTLHLHTGDDAYLEAALESFRYENQWFRASEDNWPDLRLFEEGGDPPPSMVAWCHGAAGIGLSRLRAVHEAAGESLVRDIEAAVRSSLELVVGRDRGAPRDFCLCHGYAGIGEFLWRAADVLDDPTGRDVVLELAEVGATAYGDAPDRWPCGVKRGSNPSLMIGLAGIGYFYLGLADTDLPSVLTVALEATR